MPAPRITEGEDVVTVSVSITASLLKRLDALVKVEHRTRSAMMRRVMDEGLRALEAKQRLRAVNS